MAKINNTAAYAISNTIDGSDIVIGSENGNGGDTKNFQMSDISTFVLGNAVTPTLDDVCQQGNTTTTSIQINNVGGLSILTGPLTSNGSTFLLGSSTVINGTVNINNTADIADTLTLSRATGTGLQVDANATIDGSLTVNSTALFTDAGSSISAAGLISTAGNILAFGTVAGSFLATDSAGAPLSASATGTTGSIVADANYIYVCTATDTWKRVAISTW